MLWIPRGFDWVDPLKDGRAYEKILDLRLTSRSRIAAARGDDLEEILDELQQEGGARRGARAHARACADGPTRRTPAPADEDDDPSDDDEDAPEEDDGDDEPGRPVRNGKRVASRSDNARQSSDRVFAGSSGR